MDCQTINAAAIHRWVEESWEWGRPVPHEACARARAGGPGHAAHPIKPAPHP